MHRTFLLVFVVFLICNANHASAISENNNLLVVYNQTIKIGNSDLRCYHCKTIFCEDPVRASDFEILKCSDRPFPIEFYRECDVSNISYTCMKTFYQGSVEARCSYANIDNQSACDTLRRRRNGTAYMAHFPQYIIQNLSHTNNVPPQNDFPCSSCDTDLCNNV